MKVFTVTRWQVLDVSRAAEARARLDAAGAVFDDERHVQARQRDRAVDVKKVDRQDRLGLGPQGTCATCRRGGQVGGRGEP